MKTILYLSLSLAFLLTACSPMQDQAKDTETELLKSTVKELEQYIKEKGLTPEEYSIDIREGYEHVLTKEEIQLSKKDIDEYARLKATSPYN